MAGVQRLPRQSVNSAGGSSVMPSHQTPPSGVSATFVKMVFVASVAIAFGLVLTLVPGATAPDFAGLREMDNVFFVVAGPGHVLLAWHKGRAYGVKAGHNALDVLV